MKHRITGDVDDEYCDAKKWDIPVSSLRFKRPMVCSDCLRDNSYCRKFWDLPAVTVCPQHHSLLLDICPNCRKRITWNRKSVSRCHCGCDWRETMSTELPPTQRRAMSLLMRSYAVSESDQATMSSSAAPFEQLSFGDLSRVMLCLARFVSDGEPGMDPLLMENHLLHQSLERVVAILDGWPNAFHSLCDRHSNNYSSRGLASHLNRLADRPSLMFLPLAMEEHWIKTARRSFPTYNFFPEQRFIPIEEAGKRMGLSREQVNIFASAGRLRSASSVSDPQTTLIDARSIDKLFEERRGMITVRMAATNLGITVNELFELIDYGHLRIVGGPQIDGFPDTVLDADSILHLYYRVKGGSLPTSETAMSLLIHNGRGELMRFNEVREQLNAKNLNFGRWLQAVIDGEILPLKLRPMSESGDEGVRLTRFAFRRDQIQQYFARSGMGQSSITTKAG